MPVQPGSNRKVQGKMAPGSTKGSVTGAAYKTAASLPLRTVGVGLFLLSAASLAFEITLTHLFSLVFQYHFAFLAVSCAILGLGIGAALGYWLKPMDEQKAQSWLGRVAALFSLALPLVIVLFCVTGFTPGIILQAMLGALPFVAIGLFSACLYALYSQKAAWLYAFDLAGAGAGLLGIQVLLNWVSASSAGFILGLLAGAASLIFVIRLSRHPLLPHEHRAGKELSKFGLVFVALALAAIGLIVNLTSRSFDHPFGELNSIPPDKTMFRLLADPTSGSKLLGSAWSSFARVDLLSSPDSGQEYIFTNGGAGSYMLRFNGDLSTVKSLTQELEYLPFDQFKPQKTLVLGAGAGKDVLQALLAGSSQITAVEINPAMVALTRRNGAYNGNIFDYPGVQTVVADGRNYIERTNEAYNMIYLNLVYAQAPSPGSNALSEAYIFTTQAFQTYWHHLAPDGRLAIIAHQGLEGVRALLTALKALELDGIPIKDGLPHTALLMYSGGDVNQNTTVLVLQKSPLTQVQVEVFVQSIQTLGLQPLFLPGVYENLMSDLTSEKMTLDTYLSHQDYNLFPTTDDQPFFFNLNPGLPEALTTLLFVAGAGLALYLLLGLGIKHCLSPWQLVYFGALGMGFMLMEVPLIQRTIMLVSSPTLAIALVLAPLLLGGGLGSLWSSRWPVEKLWPRLALAGAVIIGMGAVFALSQPILVKTLIQLDSTAGALLAGLALLPLGFVMGIPFSNGLRLVGSINVEALPYLWGWNAMSSVAGSAMAATLAMLAGFGVVMGAGAACYGLVMIVAVVMTRKV